MDTEVLFPELLTYLLRFSNCVLCSKAMESVFMYTHVPFCLLFHIRKIDFMNLCQRPESKHGALFEIQFTLRQDFR